MKIRTAVIGVMTLAIVNTFTAYAGEGVPPYVLVDRATTVSKSLPKEYAGAVESINSVDIIPRVTGILLKMDFEEGSIVKKGQLLYEIEDTTYAAAVEILKAQKQELLAYLEYASEEYQRKDKLLRDNVVSVSSHDKAEMDIQAAEAKVKELEASLIDANNTLSYTKIYAPITGMIGKSNFTEGNLLTPERGVLVEIEQVAPIYVKFSLSERVFEQDFGGRDSIKNKADIQLRLANNLLFAEKGEIALIDNKINHTTNTITIWAKFMNTDNKLIPGGYVTVLLSCKSSKAFVAVVPSALIAENDGYYIYVLDAQNKAIKRKVTIGQTTENGMLIILSGVKDNERVVIDGTHKVKPGMIVKPVMKNEAK